MCEQKSYHSSQPAAYTKNIFNDQFLLQLLKASKHSLKATTTQTSKIYKKLLLTTIFMLLFLDS